MATLDLTVKYLGEAAAGNHLYEFTVSGEGIAYYTWINIYCEVVAGNWEYLFMINVSSGSGSQEYTIGHHLAGQSIRFWAGVTDKVWSNQVTVIVGEGAAEPEPAPGPTPGLPVVSSCIMTAIGAPLTFLTGLRTIRAYLPGWFVRGYYSLSAFILAGV